MAKSAAPTRTGAKGFAKNIALSCSRERARRLVVIPQSGQGMPVRVRSGHGMPVPSGVTWRPTRPMMRVPEMADHAVRCRETDRTYQGDFANGLTTEGALKAGGGLTMTQAYRVLWAENKKGREKGNPSSLPK